MTSPWCHRLLTRAIGIVIATAVQASAADVSPGEIAALVALLGDEDYAVRETASVLLAELGPAAADALLAAAEVSDDLEVALRSRWLADSIPLASPDDPPEVAVIIEPFAKSDLGERMRIMHRLLRLDDDVGIEPLARIVRLERTAKGSRVAAALLTREWQRDDPYWSGLAPRILAGLGPSARPAATFLRGLVAGTTAQTPADMRRGIDQAIESLATLDARPEHGGDAGHDFEADANVVARTTPIFRRAVAELLDVAGRRDEALAQAAKLFDTGKPHTEEDDSQAVADLEWLTTHGLADAVEVMAGRFDQGDKGSPLLEYAAAAAWRARARPDAAARAKELADDASRRLAEAGEFTARLQAAMQLVRWGCDDWAEREYRALLGDRGSSRALLALTAVLASEFLHDRERHAEAAAVLARELDTRGKEDDAEGAFLQIERDPRSVRSRMLYFSACDAAAAGDKARERQLLETSLRAYPKDVDTLIALFNLPDATPAQKAEAAQRVARGLAAIEEEIRALPDDPNCRNEYAWLVANTAGDLARAIEYSRYSLERTFDSPSYLDTLAHCHAAAGEFTRAIRTQWLAVRHEPHGQTIRRNLAEFQARAAKAEQPKRRESP